jgi:hypothetical protein
VTCVEPMVGGQLAVHMHPTLHVSTEWACAAAVSTRVGDSALSTSYPAYPAAMVTTSAHQGSRRQVSRGRFTHSAGTGAVE